MRDRVRIRNVLFSLTLLGLMISSTPMLLAQEFGSAVDNGASGPRNMGPRLKAGALSLLMPGAGQWYNDDRAKSWKFGVAEMGVWTAYLVFNNQRNGYAEDSRDYAEVYAGVSGSHPESYWRSVGEYMNSDDYNTQQLIDARAEGSTTAELISGDEAWFWRNEELRSNYIAFRGKVTSARERRDFMILFSVLNRVISAFDAVRNANGDDQLLSLAGFDIDLQHSTYQGTSGAVCTFSKKF
jgi:uncharacterized protein DUF5683